MCETNHTAAVGVRVGRLCVYRTSAVPITFAPDRVGVMVDRAGVAIGRAGVTVDPAPAPAPAPPPAPLAMMTVWDWVGGLLQALTVVNC